MTDFALMLANPILVAMSLLILIVALYKALTMKFESVNIPVREEEIKAFNFKRNFLWFAVFICGILPLMNFILVLVGS